ncbi:hypothetical protein CYY_010112, partial [Polysphondylium violaceum]
GSSQAGGLTPIDFNISEAVTYTGSNQAASKEELAMIDEMAEWSEKDKDILFQLYFEVMGEIGRNLRKTIYNKDRLLAFIIKMFKNHYHGGETGTEVVPLRVNVVGGALVKYNKESPNPIVIPRPDTGTILPLDDAYLKNYTASQWVARYQHLAFSEDMEPILIAKIDPCVLRRYFCGNGVSIRTIFQKILLAEMSQNVTLKEDKLASVKWDPATGNLKTYLTKFSTVHQQVVEIPEAKEYEKRFKLVDPTIVQICRSGLPKIIEPEMKKLMNEKGTKSLADFFQLCDDNEALILTWLEQKSNQRIGVDGYSVNNVVEMVPKTAGDPTPIAYTGFRSEQKRDRSYFQRDKGGNQPFRKNGHKKPFVPNVQENIASKTCWYCGKKGHLQSKCNKRTSDKKVNKPVYRLTTKGGMTLPKLVGKTTVGPLTCLLDTGATCNVISKNLIPKDYVIFPTNKHILDVNGGDKLAVGEVVIPFSFTCNGASHKWYLKFVVIESNEEIALIGSPTLKERKTILDMETHTLYIKKESPMDNSLKSLDIESFQVNCVNYFKQLVNQISLDPQSVNTWIIYRNEVVDPEPATAPEMENNPYQDRIVELIKEKFPSLLEPLSGAVDRGDLNFAVNTNSDIPTVSPMFKIPESQLKPLRGALDEMIAANQIRLSKSPYSAAMIFVPKPDGSLRPCVDYRKLNSITDKDHYPLPMIDHLLQKTKDAKLFSKIDLSKAFHQVLVREGDQAKLAFKTVYGTFEYLVMPFGTKNAPSCFQRLMDTIFEKLIRVGTTAPFIDDLLIMSKTTDIDNHIRDVMEVCKVLDEHKLKISLKKCLFGVKTVPFLGHVVGGGKITPAVSKINAIREFPIPTDKTKLRGFLGIVGYLRNHIKNLATMEAPLFELLKKDAKWVWLDQHQVAFESIKDAISETNSLSMPDYSKPFYLCCDASDLGIGHVLFQKDSQGNKNVIAFGSRTLRPSEKNYTTLEKELLAIVDALKSRHYTLWGHEVNVLTDHSNIIHIINDPKKTTNQRVLRWFELINGFNVRLSYIKGAENTIADSLSRNPKLSILHTKVAKDITNSSVINDIVAGYKLESDKCIADKDKNQLLYDIAEFCKEDGLYRAYGKVVVPKVKKVIDKIIAYFHNFRIGGHFSLIKTYDLIYRYFVWTGMKDDIDSYIKSCHICCVSKYSKFKPQGKLVAHQKPLKCFDDICVDFVVALPTNSCNGVDYNRIMVIVDRYSKMTRLFPLPSPCSAEIIIDIFEKDFVKIHGYPKVITSDNDTLFTSKVWTDYVQDLNINHLFSLPYHQQANGQVERYISTINDLIRSMFVEKTAVSQIYHESDLSADWLNNIHLIEFSLNNSLSTATGYSPFFVYHGESPNLAMDLHLGLDRDDIIGEDVVDDDVERRLKGKRHIMKIVDGRLKEALEKMRIQYNRGYKEISTKVNDIVYVQRNKRDSKFSTRFWGPVRVNEIYTNNNVEVKWQEDNKEYKAVVPMKRLKPAGAIDKIEKEKLELDLIPSITDNLSIKPLDMCVKAFFEYPPMLSAGEVIVGVVYDAKSCSELPSDTSDKLKALAASNSSAKHVLLVRELLKLKESPTFNMNEENIPVTAVVKSLLKYTLENDYFKIVAARAFTIKNEVVKRKNGRRQPSETKVCEVLVLMGGTLSWVRQKDFNSTYNYY